MGMRLSTSLRNSLLTTGDFKTLMDAGFLYIYSGTPPASADSALPGGSTLLCVISVDSGATGGTFAEPAAGVISKTGGETWSGLGLAAGTAGWFRFHALATDETTTRARSAAADPGTGADYERFDGTIGVSGADMNLSNTSIAVGATQTITSFSVTLPASA